MHILSIENLKRMRANSFFAFHSWHINANKESEETNSNVYVKGQTWKYCRWFFFLLFSHKQFYDRNFSHGTQSMCGQ